MDEINLLQKDDAIRLDLLLTLAHRYHDSDAEKILKEDLFILYNMGKVNLITKLRNDGFFDIFDVQELESLIFNSESFITQEFLNMLKFTGVSVQFLTSQISKFKTIDSEAVRALLIEEYLLFGVEYVSENSEDIKEQFSKDRLNKIFNFYRKLKLKYVET